MKVVARSTSTFPVSRSTRTSTISPANTGPTPLGSDRPVADTGPPVSSSLPASSLKVIRSLGLALETNAPSSKSTSEGSVSHIRAARSMSCLRTSAAACTAAIPVEKAVRLPPVTPVQAIESVSTTVGRTSSAASPSASAACMATATRVPPMSTDPVTRLMVPSELTPMVAVELKPPLPQ